jgi:oligoribonuclease
MANFLVFMDCEMTGLDFKKHRIMEIGCVITDRELMTIDELNIIIHQDNQILSSMDEWCIENHGKVGSIIGSYKHF